MITPPFNIWASPAFNLKVPFAVRCPLREPLVSAIEEILRVAVRLAAAFLASVALLATGTTDTFAGASDLYSRLAPAPGADWVESAPGPTTLDGPFDSHSYDTYLQLVSPSTQRVEHQLNALAFRSGYARMWVQGSSQDVLSERVFQFGDALGAAAWYANLKQQNQFTKYLVKVIPPLDGHPDSFGVVLKTPDFKSYRVEFVLANLVFTVHMDSAQNDLTALAVSQALTELHSQAPSPSPARQAAAAHPSTPAIPTTVLAAAGLAGALGVVALAAVVARRRRNRRTTS
jgi:hypothetical protein